MGPSRFVTVHALAATLLALTTAQATLSNITLFQNNTTSQGYNSLNCPPTETPCLFPTNPGGRTGGYTCCPNSTQCMTSGPYAGTCAVLPPSSQQCSPSSICIPDRINAPDTAQCCAPEESCTPGTGCEYRRPHFCPSGKKRCSADDRCVDGWVTSTGTLKGEFCCPKRCVVGNQGDTICCGAGGTCKAKGCEYAFYSQCGVVVCGLHDRCIGADWASRACCPTTRLCGNTCCPQADAQGAFVCVDENKGLCCRQGEIKTSSGTCCPPGSLAAGDICCEHGGVPNGHGCLP